MIRAASNKKSFTPQAFFLFFISPLIGLIGSLTSLNQKGRLWALTIFGLFYGLLINYDAGADASRHALNLEYYYDIGFEEYFEILIGIVTFNPIKSSSLVDLPSDLYLHILSGIAGAIFQSSNVLFGIVGTVYGYFYGSAIIKLVSFANKPLKKYGVLTLGILLLFLVHRSYENMQTIRSWTGLWVLFNGVFGYYLTENKKYLILILVTPLIHLMYGFICVPAILVVLLRRFRLKLVYVVLFIFSLVVNVNAFSVIESYFASNAIVEKKLDAYYEDNEEGGFDPIAARKARSNARWYARLGKTTAVYQGAIVFLFTLILSGVYLRKKSDAILEGLISTALLTGTLANLLSFSYAFYSRTMANATIFILAAVLYCHFNKDGDIIPRRSVFTFGSWIGLIIFIPKLVYFLSDFLHRTSFLLISFPFAGLAGENLNPSIRDVIDIFL